MVDLMDQRISKLTALCGVLAASMAVIVVQVGSIIQPDYSQTKNYISELNDHGSHYAVLIGYIGFLPTGLLTLIFLNRLKEEILPSIRATIGILCLSFLGIDWVVTAIAPCEIGCVASNGISLSQSIHDLSGFFVKVFVPLGIYLLIKSFKAASFGTDITIVSFLSISVTLLSSVLMLSGDFTDAKGLIQRIDLGIQYSYIVLLSIKTYQNIPVLPE